MRWTLASLFEDEMKSIDLEEGGAMRVETVRSTVACLQEEKMYILTG